MKLSTKQRAVLREMFGGRCAYCGHDLPAQGWHADHIEPVVRKGVYVRVDEPGRSHKFVSTGECHRPENQRKDNFFPSCRACNIDKAASNLEDWRQYLQDRIRICRDNHAAFRHLERFGLVVVRDEPVVFYFERLHGGEKDSPIDSLHHFM